MTQELVERPGRDFAITERGTKTRHSEAEIDLALRLVALAGGKTTIAVEQLASENIRIARTTLDNWVNHSFPQRYRQIRRDLGAEIGEDVAGRALERARMADEAQELLIEQTISQVDRIPPAHLAKAVAAIATAKQSDVQVSQLLRDRPTEIKRIDVNATISALERAGVLEKADKAIDAEVVSEEDA